MVHNKRNPAARKARKDRTTAAEVNDAAEPEVAALATAMPASAKTFMDVEDFLNSIALSIEAKRSEPVNNTANRKDMLEVVVHFANYFITHPKMMQVGDTVLQTAQSGIVDDGKKIMGLLKGRLVDEGYYSEDYVVFKDETADVLHFVVWCAKYLFGNPEKPRSEDSDIKAAEDTMADMVIRTVGLVDGHPAAGRLALG